MARVEQWRFWEYCLKGRYRAFFDAYANAAITGTNFIPSVILELSWQARGGEFPSDDFSNMLKAVGSQFRQADAFNPLDRYTVDVLAFLFYDNIVLLLKPWQRKCAIYCWPNARQDGSDCV